MLANNRSSSVASDLSAASLSPSELAQPLGSAEPPSDHPSHLAGTTSPELPPGATQEALDLEGAAARERCLRMAAGGVALAVGAGALAGAGILFAGAAFKGPAAGCLTGVAANPYWGTKGAECVAACSGSALTLIGGGVVGGMAHNMLGARAAAAQPNLPEATLTRPPESQTMARSDSAAEIQMTPNG